MRIAESSQPNPKIGIIVFVVLALVTANTLAILFALGLFTLWEAVIALFTVLTLAAGTIWTMMRVPRMSASRIDQQEIRLEGSPE